MIHLAQLLCPERHCVIGFGWAPEIEQAPVDEMLGRFAEMFSQMVELELVNPWCGLCHSRDLNWEDRETSFATLDEAEPHLRESEREQQLSRILIDVHRGAKN